MVSTVYALAEDTLFVNDEM